MLRHDFAQREFPVKQPAAANPPIDPHHKAIVGIARGSSMEDAVRQAVGLAGGLTFIKRGPNGPDQAERHGGRPVPHDDQPRGSLRGDQARGRARPETDLRLGPLLLARLHRSGPENDQGHEVRGPSRRRRGGKKRLQSPRRRGRTGSGRPGVGAPRPTGRIRPFGGGSSRPTPRIGPTASSRPSCSSPSIT